MKPSEIFTSPRFKDDLERHFQPDFKLPENLQNLLNKLDNQNERTCVENAAN
jgi:hypothetical protein